MFTADYPGAIVVEAANYGYTGYTNNPKAFCLHTPEETPDDDPQTPYYFHNTTRNASTTYFVSYLGFVFQCVPESEGAYANAREGVPGLFDWETPNYNLNLETLSVEIEGFAASIHQTMSRGSAQWNALVALMAHRCSALGIPPERTFGHYQVSKSRRDPGQLDIIGVVADVKAAMKTEVDMFLVKGTPSERFYVVGATGKRYIDDQAELSIYGARLTTDTWADADIANIPDIAVAGVDTDAIATAVRAKLKADPLK